jgi:inner membrane protein
VLHRAETHALFWQTLASPVLAAIIAWVTSHRGVANSGPGPGPEGRVWQHYPAWLCTVWLALVTHALLDAMTVYGTQLALPFSSHPYGVGSIFIIDPLYTLPLLLGLAASLASRRTTAGRWNLAGLALSCAYLLWSAAAQHYVEGLVRSQWAGGPGALPAEKVLVTPTPFNTVLWRVLVMRPDGYEEGFYSLLDQGRPIRTARFERDPALYEQLRGLDAVDRIAAFSHGFFRVHEREGSVRITDLRMGQEPSYVFSFEVATRASPLTPLVPPRQMQGRQDINVAASLRWMWRRMLGEDIDPPR